MSASSRGRWVYLAFYAANAALLPVLTLYYESVGVHGARLGVLAAIWPAGSVLGASLWGAVADASGRHRLVLSGTIIASALLAQALFLGEGFVTLVPIVTVFALSVAPVGPMLDNSVLLDLGTRQERFGRVRLWGAIGWGVSAPLVGLLIDRTALAIVFPIYGLLMFVLLATSLTLPVPRTSIGSGIFGGFARIAGDRSWRFFLLLVLAAGTGSAFVHHYLFIYLAEIGGTGTIRGLALAVATLSELLIFGLADRILARVRARLLIVIAMAAAGIRMVAMGFIADPWLALGPQLLHGMSFSLLLVAGVDIARRLAPEGMGATAQALFSGTHMGAGGIAGALIGGVLYRSMPVSRVYLV
ncbi:MAG: MFS transporter, partial [Spirochaetota bacterium]